MDFAEGDNNLGTWTKGIFVDEFGDPTNKKYIVNIASGYFTNSAEDNGKLKVKMYLEKEPENSIWFRIYEYERNLVKYYGTRNHYLKCKCRVDGEDIFKFDITTSKGDFFKLYALWNTRKDKKENAFFGISRKSDENKLL